MSFQDLPAEIRAKVWHQVAARRHIHFVKLTYPAGEQPEVQGPGIIWPKWSLTASALPGWRMLPPDLPTGDPTQWFDHSRMARGTWLGMDNPSGYRLLDTARKVNAEAQKEIDWNTAAQNWVTMNIGSGPRSIDGSIDIHTSDVLCIQLDTADPNWTFLDPRLYLSGQRQRSRLALLDEFLLGSVYPDLMQRRIAFEFNHTRYPASTQVHITGLDARESELLWIVAHLPSLGMSGTIYFIDRSIRAQAGTRPPDGREVFHASDGRYFEVASALAPGWVITSGVFRFTAYFRQRLVGLGDACHAIFQQQNPNNTMAGTVAPTPISPVDAPNPNHPNHPGSFSLSRFPLALRLCPKLWRDAQGPQNVNVKVLAFVKDENMA